MERRNKKFMLTLSPSERVELQQLADSERMSAADVVRRLIRQAVERVEDRQKRVYGVWRGEPGKGEWLILDSGEVFHTISLPVAKVQAYIHALPLAYLELPTEHCWHVRQFPDSPLLPTE